MNPSEPQFPHLHNGSGHRVFVTGLLRGLHTAPCVAGWLGAWQAFGGQYMSAAAAVPPFSGIAGQASFPVLQVRKPDPREISFLRFCRVWTTTANDRFLAQTLTTTGQCFAFRAVWVEVVG